MGALNELSFKRAIMREEMPTTHIHLPKFTNPSVHYSENCAFFNKQPSNLENEEWLSWLASSSTPSFSGSNRGFSPELNRILSLLYAGCLLKRVLAPMARYQKKRRKPSQVGPQDELL